MHGIIRLQLALGYLYAATRRESNFRLGGLPLRLRPSSQGCIPSAQCEWSQGPTPCSEGFRGSIMRSGLKNDGNRDCSNGFSSKDPSEYALLAGSGHKKSAAWRILLEDMTSYHLRQTLWTRRRSCWGSNKKIYWRICGVVIARWAISPVCKIRPTAWMRAANLSVFFTVPYMRCYDRDRKRLEIALSGNRSRILYAQRSRVHLNIAPRCCENTCRPAARDIVARIKKDFMRYKWKREIEKERKKK